MPDAELSLDRHAAIAAAIAEGTEPRSVVLERFGVSADAWTSAQVALNNRLLAELGQGQSAVADAYDAAFADAQDALGKTRELTVEEWAELGSELAREGPSALERRGLTQADHARLTRKWTKALARDAALAKQHAQAFYRLQRVAG